MEIFLLIILLLVFILPLTIRIVEHNLEIFLFVMGVLAVSITNKWSIHIIEEAIREPIKITIAVLIAGIFFRLTRDLIHNKIENVLNKIGAHSFIFLLVILLGFISSIITAIIASLVLVEIISGLKLDKKSETQLVILSCFSIGLGAALTPIGEPLSTIVIAKLDAPFFYLLKIIGIYICIGIFLLGIYSIRIFTKRVPEKESLTETKKESLTDIIVRAVKIYFFVMALIFLGCAFQVIIDKYVIKLPSSLLFWINIISAVLDNATLTAAEISNKMSVDQIQAILISLLVSGGMLIPGNIPNIIAANKLKISARTWAKFAIPIGGVLLIFYFILLFLL
jgi:predicted cation transporter